MALVSRVDVDELRVPDPRAWYFAIPAIAQLRDCGLELDPRVTVIVGENGSGKSTFVEAVAAAWRPLLTAASDYWGPPPRPEDADLHRALALAGEGPVAHGGCFLRAEAMHGLFGATAADAAAMRTFSGALNDRSHGEGFLAFLDSRLTERGLFVFDEPEAALSFASCLRLIALMDTITRMGSQVILATHSPLLAAFPGATILEFDEDGFTQRAWEELEVVRDWRAFLRAPQAFLRRLFPE